MSRNTLFELDERLALCASFVRENSRLADVGTDHAFLPVKLAAEGKILSAVASDVRTGPLKNAESNIRLYGVEDKVRAVLSDGLDDISPELADDIVIAGMGGDLMAGIIRLHIYMTPPSPAQEIDFYLDYDASYVEQAFA